MAKQYMSLRRGLALLLLLGLALALPLGAEATQPPDPQSPVISTGTLGVDHPENPGDVMLFKEAKPVAGMVNT